MLTSSLTAQQVEEFAQQCSLQVRVASKSHDRESTRLINETTTYYQRLKENLKDILCLTRYFKGEGVNKHICAIGQVKTLAPVVVICNTLDGEESTKEILDAKILHRELWRNLSDDLKDYYNKAIRHYEMSNDIEIMQLIIALGAELIKQRKLTDEMQLRCPITKRIVLAVEPAELPTYIQAFNDIIAKNLKKKEDITEADQKIIAHFIDIFVDAGLGNGDDVVVYGQSLIYIASKYGCVEQVRKLLALGADPNQVQSFADGFDRSASSLHGAIYLGQPNVVNLLLNNPFIKADCNQVIQDGQSFGDSPLYLAAYLGYTDIIEKLIHAGADLNHISRSSHLSPLYIAVLNNHVEAVEKILELGITKGLRIDQKQGEHKAHKGCTALFCASKEGYLSIVNLLLKYGADASALQDEGKYEGYSSVSVAKLFAESKDCTVNDRQIYQILTTYPSAPAEVVDSTVARLR